MAPTRSSRNHRAKGTKALTDNEAASRIQRFEAYNEMAEAPEWIAARRSEGPTGGGRGSALTRRGRRGGGRPLPPGPG